MKHTLKKSVTVLLSLLMIFTSAVPAFAADVTAALTLDNPTVYAGTAKTAVATVSGLEKAEADALKAEGFTWSASPENLCTITAGAVTDPLIDSNGTYSVSMSATLQIAKITDSSRPSVTITAASSSYTCTDTYQINIPYSSMSVSQTDAGSERHAYYNESSSTVYVDQNQSVVFDVTGSPTDNDDSVVFTSAETTGVTHSVEGTKHTVSISDKAPNTPWDIEFKSQSGAAGTVKNITLKKCVALTQYNVQYNGSTYASGGSGNEIASIAIPNIVVGDAVKIDIAKTKPSNYNDVIKYTLYNDSALTKADTSSSIVYDKDGIGCTITPSGSGTKYLLCQAQSMESSGLYRDLNCVIPINVQAANPITQINIAKSEYTIYTHNSTTLDLSKEVTTTPTDEYTDSLCYSSSDKSVATVDENTGLVTATGAGTATITVTAKRGNNTSTSASCSVTVKPAVESITLTAEGTASGEILQLPVGHKANITITKNPAEAEENIELTSSDSSILEVSGNVITAKQAGNATINARSSSNASAQLSVKVVDAVRTSTLTLTPEAVNSAHLKAVDAANSIYSIYSKESLNIKYTALGSDGVTNSNDIIEYRVSVNGGAIMTLDEATNYLTYSITGANLQITTKTEDTLVITAYAIMRGQTIDDAVAKQSITVKNYTKTTSVSFSPSSTSKKLACGASYQFEVNLNPNVTNNYDNIVAVSSNENVATVTVTTSESNKTALVTVQTLANGTADITVYATHDVNDIAKSIASKKLSVTVTNNIDYAEVSGYSDVTYTGSAIQFDDLKVVFDGTTLRDKSDYSVKYTNNTNAGTATITITANTDNYQGTKIINFTINPKDLGTCATVTAGNVTYNAKEQTPKPTVKDTERNRNLSSSTDYTYSYAANVNAGTGYVYVYGKGNYTGMAVGSFTINPLAISKASITALPSYTATGSAITPIPTLTYNNAALTYGVDYVTSYSNNVNTGTATVTIAGIGNFSGTRTATFKITEAPKSTTTTTNTATAPSGAKKVNGDYVNTKYKKASIKKLKKGKKQITVQWKKVSGVKGYQIQYSTSKKFTKKTTKSATISKQKTTSKTLKKLKSKKTYYVRIRTYKTVKFNGKTVKVYSSWSKVKSIKTK